jgi:hypothetical protein
VWKNIGTTLTSSDDSNVALPAGRLHYWNGIDQRIHMVPMELDFHHLVCTLCTIYGYLAMPLKEYVHIIKYLRSMTLLPMHAKLIVVEQKRLLIYC